MDGDREADGRWKAGTYCRPRRVAGSFEGHNGLHERPALYVPELATLDASITVYHLLSPSAGLQDAYDVPDLAFEACRLKREQESLLTDLANQPQVFAPWDELSYNSTSHLLIGYLLEHVTGEAFGDLLARLLLAPLGMKGTSVDRPRRITTCRGSGHSVEDGRAVNAGNDELSVFEDTSSERYSTVGDVKRLCDTMVICPLVSSQTLGLKFAPRGRVGLSLHHGCGWLFSPRFRGHGGGTSGFVSRIRQYPEHKVSVVPLINLTHADPDAGLTALDRNVGG